jgi:hypothetical protein
LCSWSSSSQLQAPTETSTIRFDPAYSLFRTGIGWVGWIHGGVDVVTAESVVVASSRWIRARRSGAAHRLLGGEVSLRDQPAW